MSSGEQQNSTDNTKQSGLGIFQKDFKSRQQQINKLMKIDESLDLLHRQVDIGGRQVSTY